MIPTVRLLVCRWQSSALPAIDVDITDPPVSFQVSFVFNTSFSFVLSLLLTVTASINHVAVIAVLGIHVYPAVQPCHWHARSSYCQLAICSFSIRSPSLTEGWHRQVVLQRQDYHHSVTQESQARLCCLFTCQHFCVYKITSYAGSRSPPSACKASDNSCSCIRWKWQRWHWFFSGLPRSINNSCFTPYQHDHCKLILWHHLNVFIVWTPLLL